MRNTLLIVVLTLMLCIAVYFLGRKNGSVDTKINMVQNVEMVKQIAELSALSVTGTTSAKMTNTNENAGFWGKFKNSLVENTLLVTLPYEAKYGVDLSNQKMKVDTKQQTAIIYLPKCTLLSLQLKLDQLETMNQTGLFTTTTIGDLTKVQKQMYQQAMQSMSNNAQHIREAELHIQSVFAKYYEPMGYKVECIFGDVKTTAQ